MRYMTTPKYHRDRLLRVASFPSHGIADGGLPEPLWDEIEEFRWVEPDVS